MLISRPQLELGLNIFHAVEADFTEGVKLILACNKCNDLKIIRANHYFPAGLTPMLLAARHNNYRMMLLLHENDHELPVWLLTSILSQIFSHILLISLG